jgi:hypothetical protein
MCVGLRLNTIFRPEAVRGASVEQHWGLLKLSPRLQLRCVSAVRLLLFILSLCSVYNPVLVSVCVSNCLAYLYETLYGAHSIFVLVSSIDNVKETAVMILWSRSESDTKKWTWNFVLWRLCNFVKVTLSAMSEINMASVRNLLHAFCLVTIQFVLFMRYTWYISERGKLRAGVGTSDRSCWFHFF